MIDRRKVWWGLVATGAFGISFAVSRLFVRAQTTLTPFTVTTETYMTESKRPDLPFKRSVVAVRSDGTRLSMTNVEGWKGLLARDFVRSVISPDGSKVDIYPSLRVKTTWKQAHEHQGALGLQRLVNHPPDCSIPGVLTVAGREIVAGWSTLILQHTFDLAPPTVVKDWQAPALGCTRLQSKTWQIQPDGSRKLTADTHLVSVVTGEPDPALFEVPTDYQEMKPSDVIRSVMKKYEPVPFPYDEDQKRFYENQDYAYQFGTTRPNGRYWRDAIPASPPGH